MIASGERPWIRFPIPMPMYRAVSFKALTASVSSASARSMRRPNSIAPRRVPEILEWHGKRGPLGCERFPTFAAARAACDGSIGSDPHMPEFARDAAFSAVDPAVGDNAGADPVFDKYKYEIANVAYLGPAEPELGKRGGVGVVVHGHGQAGRVGDPVYDIRVTPVKVRTVKNLSIFSIDKRGTLTPIPSIESPERRINSRTHSIIRSVVIL